MSLTLEDLQQNETADVGGEMLSLAELAGVNLDDVPEVTFQNLPAGLYLFEGLSPTFKRYGEDEVPKVGFPAKVIEAMEIANLPEGKELADYADKTHTELLKVDDMEAIGRLRVFVKEMGLPNGGELLDCINRPEGHRFLGRIVHRAGTKREGDTETPIFANLRPQGVPEQAA